MTSKLRTALTMTSLVVILALMATWGWKQTTAKLPDLGGPIAQCQTYKVKKSVKRSEIAVSVYNNSSRSGLAGATMQRFTKLGFKPGNTGNAPDGTQVRKVEVWTTTENDPTALLVAKQFKQKARVIVVQDPLGPGVDVILGQRFSGLRAKGPLTQDLPEPKRTCLD